MSTPTWRRRLRQAQRGWPPGFVLAQFPNAPLLVALACFVAGRFTHGLADAYASAGFYIALTVWAYEEAARGVNWFRRLLGAAFLVYIVVSLALKLHG